MAIFTLRDELSLFFDEKDLLVTATKHPQTIQEAPAIATIITDEQIRKMGARDLMDVLRIVPGFNVTKGYYGKEEIEVRGIKTPDSEKVKLLIDGHSVNDNYSGGAVWGFDSLTVDNIKKIEIIRGPGSALYGSNAFSAVINVITKTGSDMDGVVLSGGGGSFRTGKVNLQAGKKVNDFDVAFAFDYFDTDGQHLDVERDVVGRSGKTDDNEKKMDAQLRMAYGDFSLNTKYVKREKGMYVNVSYAMPDFSKSEIEQYFVDLSYKHAFEDKVKVTAKVYFDSLKWDTLFELYPKDTIIPASNFPDDMIAGPGIKERDWGAEVQFDYNISKANCLTLGVLAEKKDQYAVLYHANFNPSNGNYLGSVQDVSSMGNWNITKVRDIWAAYIQDLWDISKSLSLTAGVRYDHYSDFGGATDPRAALVWNFSKGWDLKFLYGEAFLAPSFEKLYNTANPVVTGKSTLHPEKMRTYEVSLGYLEKSHLAGRLSFFHNNFDNKIQLVPQSSGAMMYDNTGGAVVYGFEAEMKREFDNNTYLYANYSYQEAEDKDTGKRLPDVPNHRGNIGVNFPLTRYLNVNSNMFMSGERHRADSDSRNALPAYALVDLTLIAKDFFPNFEVRGTVHNLFDKRYADPAPPNTVENDFPREGLSLMFEALYKF